MGSLRSIRRKEPKPKAVPISCEKQAELNAMVEEIHTLANSLDIVLQYRDRVERQRMRFTGWFLFGCVLFVVLIKVFVR